MQIWFQVALLQEVRSFQVLVIVPAEGCVLWRCPSGAMLWPAGGSAREEHQRPSHPSHVVKRSNPLGVVFETFARGHYVKALVWKVQVLPASNEINPRTWLDVHAGVITFNEEAPDRSVDV